MESTKNPDGMSETFSGCFSVGDRIWAMAEYNAPFAKITVCDSYIELIAPIDRYIFYREDIRTIKRSVFGGFVLIHHRKGMPIRVWMSGGRKLRDSLERWNWFQLGTRSINPNQQQNGT
jgi:hypothetical protein